MSELSELAGQMPRAEQLAILAGQDAWTVPGAPSVGLGSIKMSDGPNGVRGADFVGGVQAVLFPSGTALAATWNTPLVEEVGRALGAEAHSKSAHVHLAPTVNLHRGPLGGRNFECFSEDPFLTARMAVAYVRGVQSQGVASCVKHLVANDYEYERFTNSSEVEERVLREVYLKPFQAALVEAGAWSVMSAYNRLNGTWCSEHPWLLTKVLRDDWAWDGAVVSDWYGTHSTVQALWAGLDIEMPGPPQFRGPALAEALASGGVAQADVRRAAERILLLARRTRALGSERRDEPERFDDDPARTQLARRAAAESIVLLRNEPVGKAPLLPLAEESLRRLAVVGPNAALVHAQGGGSAGVRPPYLISPLRGLREALPGVEVVHEAACGPATAAAVLDRTRIRVPAGEEHEGEAGMLLAYYPGRDFNQAPAGHRVVRRSDLFWAGGTAPGVDVEPGDWSLRIVTSYRARTSGSHELYLVGLGQLTLKLDGRLLHAEETTTGQRPALTVELAADQDHVLEIELLPPRELPRLFNFEVRLEEPPDPDRLRRAAELAASADAAVVVVGMDADAETEGRDRPSFDLPPVQQQLIAAIAAANPATVVVVNSGSVVGLEWADEVPAVVQLWCAGQEAGRALADVLLGRVEAGGRLPTTVPRRLDDTPAHAVWPGRTSELRQGRAPYTEGLHIGYRHYLKNSVIPRYWFGHGLSYTSFSFGEMDLEAGTDGIHCRVAVTNTGERTGWAVPQLYFRLPDSGVERPELSLGAFAKLSLQPGQTASVDLLVRRSELAYWSGVDQAWVHEPGPVELFLGESAGHIARRARINMPSDE